MEKKKNQSLATRKRKSNKTKYRRVQFVDTAVGHYMFVYAPVEYNMLLDYITHVRKTGYSATPILVEHIELIAVKTNSPAFKTTTFRKAIMAYREYGLNPPKKAHWTLRDAVHYAKFSNVIHKQMKECERFLA